MSVLDQRANRDDIVAIYKSVLSRRPETIDVLEAHFASNRSIAEHIGSTIESAEFRGKVISKLFEEQFYAPKTTIETTADDSSMVALERHIEKVWSDYGRDDPHWSVITGDEYRADAMDTDAEAKFYQSGKRDVDHFLDLCADNGLAPAGKVVDFGCGVGRLGEHLSASFSQYEGVDISRPHLDIASKRFDQIDRTNTKTTLLPDFIARNDGFDCFFTLIVLQHNPPPTMLMLLTNLLSRLRPGGVGYFQLPCLLFGYEFKLSNYLDLIADGGSMEMHALPQAIVLEAINESGCRLVDFTPDALIGGIGLSYTFLVAKPA